MYTYLGIDNVQKNRLVLVCHSFQESGEVRPLWRAKLRSDAAIGQFFCRLAESHLPVTMVTTWVGRDPGGVLENHVQRGGLLLRYHPWEVSRLKPTLSLAYQRANSLALQAIQDEQLPSMLQALRYQLDSLQIKCKSLIDETCEISRRLNYLECSQLEFDEVPF
jgi:hypothetical protein